MTRLFIAIDIPNSVRHEVAGLGYSIPYARPVPVEQLHITLKFLGETEGSKVLDIKDILQEISHQSFSLCLKGLGVFPPRGVPRVFWAGIAPLAEITALRQSIEGKLAAIAIPREKQKFAPHLTLARLNNSPIKRLQEILAGNGLLQTRTFTIDSFHLFKSQLTAKGAIHTILQTYPLLDTPSQL